MFHSVVGAILVGLVLAVVKWDRQQSVTPYGWKEIAGAWIWIDPKTGCQYLAQDQGRGAMMPRYSTTGIQLCSKIGE